MNETWVTLTAEEVFGQNVKEKLSIVAIKGQDDLPAVVTNVVEQIREAYRSGGRPLGEEGTIPSGMKARAIAMALWLFITTGVARNDAVHTKEREKAYNDALEYLNKIALRELKGSGSAQIVSKVERQATRAKLSGL